MENSTCPYCGRELLLHNNEELKICASNELKKLTSLESDSTPKSSEETPTGGFII
jgi:hypothetical protein